MKIKDYIDGLFYLFMGADENESEKHEGFSGKEKILIILLFFLISAVGYSLLN